MYYPKTKKDKIIYWACVIGMVSIFYIIGSFKKRSLDKNLKYSIAVVYNFYTVRTTDYFDYKFFVNEKEYEGGSIYYRNSVNIGDTIIVGYDSTNPKNNTVWSYENAPHLYLLYGIKASPPQEQKSLKLENFDEINTTNY